MSSTGQPATASICGFDVGSENCYIGIAAQGGIEIILNEYSQRSTPAFISLNDKQRELGVSAKQKQLTNLNNTFNGLSRLVGRQFNEVTASENLSFPAELSDTGELAVKVWINDEEVTYSATQLLAMLFTKLRQVANNAVDCVINCGNWFTDGQRRALRDAAVIAGLNPLRILNDMTAVGIYYSLYRVGNNTSNAIVGFVDVGASSTQCAIIYFEKTVLQVLAVEYEPNLGGKHFDSLIANHFIKEQNLTLSKRAYLRLVAECEKLKKQMSANSNVLPINVECLQDDKDFTGRMDRATFEKLAENHLTAIENVFKRTYERANTRFNELIEERKKREEQENKEGKKSEESKPMEFKINVVEIVGGASRIPAVKRFIKDIFGVEASTTLNADEAVARGCALQCAMLSPSFRVARELQIIDYSPYQINCKYWHDSEKETKTHSVSPLFVRGSPMPLARQIIATCRSLPMIFELEYISANGHTTSIGQFKVTSREPIEITGNKLRVRVRLDADGLVSVVGASIQLEDKSVASKEEGKASNENIPKDQSAQMDTDDGSRDGNTGDQTSQTEGGAASQDKDSSKESKQPNKVKLITVDLIVETLWLRGKLSESDLSSLQETEANLILNDKKWKELVDARNELEEYVYEWRDKLEEGRYDCYTQPNDKQNFLVDLKSTEQWLYEDEDAGSTQKRAVYVEKLTALKSKYSDSIVYRLREFESRPGFLEQLGKSVQMAQKLISTPETIDVGKMSKLKDTFDETQKWFENAHSILAQASTYADPPITIKDIKERIENMESANRSVMEEIQKIRLERQREEDRKKKEEEAKKKEAEQQQQQPQAGGDKPSEPGADPPSNQPMEVD